MARLNEEAAKQKMNHPPKTVVVVKKVELTMVTYVDANGQQISQLALVGDSHVQLLNNVDFGFGEARTSKGPANDWLVRGVMEKLGRTKNK